MPYKLKMFFLWIWSHILDFVYRNQLWFLTIIGIVAVVLSVICLAVDILIAKNPLDYSIDFYNYYNLIRIPAYLTVFGFIVLFINEKVIPLIRSKFTSAQEDFLEFSSNGGKSKKKKNSQSHLDEKGFDPWGDNHTRAKLRDLMDEQVRKNHEKDERASLMAQEAEDNVLASAYRNGYSRGIRKAIERHTQDYSDVIKKVAEKISEPELPTIYDRYPDLDSADPDHASNLKIDIESIQMTISELQESLQRSIEIDQQRITELQLRRAEILRDLLELKEQTNDSRVLDRLTILKNELETTNHQITEVNDNLLEDNDSLRKSG